MKPITLQGQIWTQWVPAIAIVAVMSYYGWFLYVDAMNVPYQDDIIDVLQFLVSIVQLTDISQAFGIFFHSHNEHRTLSSRLVYFLVYEIAGEINFRTLIFVAHFSLVAQLLLLHLAIRNRSQSLWLLLPAALILFQPRAYELFSSGMAAFAYMFVYLYGFASLLCLREVKLPRFLAAIVFAALAMFTLASGQLVWLVGLASLLQQSLILRRCSLAYPLCWLLCGALLLFVWYFGHETPHTTGVVIKDVLDSPMHHIAFFFTLMGSAATNTSVSFAGCVGFLMFCTVFYWSIRSIASENATLDLFAWYLILTMLAITAGRAHYVSTTYALESRLSFPSELLLVVVTVMCLSRISDVSEKMKIGAAVVSVAVFYWAVSFLVYPAYIQGQFQERVNAYNEGRYWIIFHSIEKTNSIVEEAVTLGIYHPVQRPLTRPDVAPYARTGSSAASLMRKKLGDGA